MNNVNCVPKQTDGIYCRPGRVILSPPPPPTNYQSSSPASDHSQLKFGHIPVPPVNKDIAQDVRVQRQKEIRDLMKKSRERAVLVDRISCCLFQISFILLNIVYWALFGDHDLWQRIEGLNFDLIRLYYHLIFCIDIVKRDTLTEV